MKPEELRALAAHRKSQYPQRMRVRLVRFAADALTDDNNVVPAGTCGTITLVDDLGTIHVAWDNGSTLGLTSQDTFEAVPADTPMAS